MERSHNIQMAHSPNSKRVPNLLIIQICVCFPDLAWLTTIDLNIKTKCKNISNLLKSRQSQNVQCFYMIHIHLNFEGDYQGTPSQLPGNRPVLQRPVFERISEAIPLPGRPICREEYFTKTMEAFKKNLDVLWKIP